MKVLIATPLHDGRAERDFINGLLQCHGLYYAWACVEGQANISLARDMLAGQFLASDCTTLVMIDGDIGFGRQRPGGAAALAAQRDERHVSA